MGLLRKAASLLLLALPLYADQVVSTSFKGLNSNENPVIIEPSQAQNLLNVDVTPGGKSVKKRTGYGVYQSLGTGQAVHGGYHAFNSSGNSYQLWASSRSLYSIIQDASPAQIISSATLNATWDCADTQANSYCVNSARDLYLQTNGTTKTWYPSPLGTMIETTPDRVVVSGVSGALSTLYISQSNTFTNFVTGVNATDAFTEVIASPGSRITHIRWGCGKLLWWKDQSFGYLDFDDQYTAQVKTISDSIGTLDNTSAVDPGGQVWFRGQDGHTWKYDCSILTKESIDITPNVRAAGSRIENSWTQTTSADFVLGYSSNVSTSNDQVALAYFEDSFTDLSNWTQLNTWSVSGGIAQSPNVGSYSALSKTAAISGLSSSGYRVGVVGAWQMEETHSTSSGIEIGIINSSTQGYVAGFGRSPTTGKVNVSFISLNGSLGSTGQTLIGTPADASSNADTGFHLFELYFNDQTNTLTAYYDGVSINSTTDSTYSSLTNPVIRCYDQFSLTCQFDSFSVGNSTGTFYSAVHNASAITGWGTLSVNNQAGGGTQTFYLRSSTNSFTVQSSTPSWTAQSAGNLISISTGTYFQLRDEFTGAGSSQTVSLNDFTINWVEGAASDQAYMLYFDNAIWESVAFGPGQSSNNYIFKKDLINDAWTLYNFGAGGMLAQNNRLYFGDTSAGNIFRYGDATSDNGSAISAFWKSKAYTGPDPFLQTQLSNIDVFAKKDEGSVLSSTYTLNTSTSTSYTIDLSSGSSIIQSRKLLPSGKLGYTFDLSLGDNSTSSSWEILGYRIGFTQLPYRASTP